MQQFNGTLIAGTAVPVATGPRASTGNAVIPGVSGGPTFDTVLQGAGPETLPPGSGDVPRSMTGSLLPPAGTALPDGDVQAGGLAAELVGYFDAELGTLDTAAGAARETGMPLPVMQPGAPALAYRADVVGRDVASADFVITGTGKYALQARPAEVPLPPSAVPGTTASTAGLDAAGDRLPGATPEKSVAGARDWQTAPILSAGREPGLDPSQRLPASALKVPGGLDGQNPDSSSLSRGINMPASLSSPASQDERSLARASLLGAAPGSELENLLRRGRAPSISGGLAGPEAAGTRGPVDAPVPAILRREEGLSGRRFSNLRTAADQTVANRRFAATPAASGQLPEASLPGVELGARTGAVAPPVSGAGASLAVSLPGNVTPASAAVAQPAPPTASFTIDTPVLDPAWQNAVNDRMVWMAGRNLQSAELRLNPAELGPVQVQVSVDDKAVSLSITAAHPLTREALESALPRLRDMLSENGMDLTGANVSDGGVDGRGDGGFEEQREVEPDIGDALAAEPTGADGSESARKGSSSRPDGAIDLFA